MTSATPLHRKNRFWCFTLNNPPDDAATTLHAAFCNDPTVVCSVFCFEVAPTTGTVHLQGYFELLPPGSSRAALLPRLNPRMYLEPARGSRRDNYVYCTKSPLDATAPYEHRAPYSEFSWSANRNANYAGYEGPLASSAPGDKRKRGDTGTQLLEVRKHFRGGGNVTDIVNDDSLIHLLRHERLFSIISGALAVTAVRPFHRKIIILFGLGGTGKTVRAKQLLSGMKTFTKEPSIRFWDGLQPTMTALHIEEMAPKSSIPLSTLKQILDTENQGLQCDIKCKSPYLWNPSHVIITSNYHPSDWYEHPDSGLLRRTHPLQVKYTQSIEILSPIWTRSSPIEWPADLLITSYDTLPPPISLPQPLLEPLQVGYDQHGMPTTRLPSATFLQPPLSSSQPLLPSSTT